MPDRGLSPKAGTTVNLGSETQKWEEIYVNHINAPEMNNDHNNIFRGQEITDSWATIQSNIQAGNFDNYYIGDYKTITLTTNETVVMEIAGINCYKGCGNTAIGNHIDFISRDCLATAYQFNATDTNNGTASYIAPWQRSDLYYTLNTATVTTIPSDLSSVITNKLGYIEERYSSGGQVSADTGAGWYWMERLWVPSEIEVFGHATWSETGYGTAGFLQYPIFRLNPSKIIKGAGNNGTVTDWWTLSAARIDSSSFCKVAGSGEVKSSYATVQNRVPLCFRIA